MKNKGLIFCIVFLVLIATACTNNIKEADLPSIVLNSFKTKFANATDAEWQKAGNAYEVEFELNGVEHAAQIDDSGNVRMIKQEITAADLPTTISTAITQQYKNHKIDEVEKVEHNQNIFFQVELDGKKDEHIVFTANGSKETSIPYWD